MLCIVLGQQLTQQLTQQLLALTMINWYEFFTFAVMCSLCSVCFPLPLSVYYQHVQNTGTKYRNSGVVSLVVVHPILFSIVRSTTHTIVNKSFDTFYTNTFRDFPMIFAAILMQDTLFYWLHYLLHCKWFYGIHKTHHTEHDPTVWSTFHASVREMLLCNCITMIVPAVVCNLGYVSFGIFQASLLCRAIRAHTKPHIKSNDSMSHMTADFHHTHHKYGNCNYGGFHFVFWDQLMNTVRM